MKFIREQATEKSPSSIRDIKILIAEDSNSDRLLLKTFLQRLNYQVLAACDGVEALELFAQQRPAIVLLDVLMPRMDGFDTAQRIRQLAGDDFVPIIFLTSLQQADLLARCLDVGGDDFLVKPYNRIVLQAKLNAFERMREMHRTLQQQRDEIASHNNRLLREQQVAKRVFDKVAHVGCLEAGNIQYSLSPLAIFNGDVALAGVGPAGNLLVLLGDFTGHGLHAAIGAMPMAQTFYSMLGKGYVLVDILREINKVLHSILPVDIFCCAVIAEINFKSGILKVWNGGLPDCVIYRHRDRSRLMLPSAHPPLGILSNRAFNGKVQSYSFEPQDRLFLWSDGIHEAVNEQGEMFGEQRLMELFERNSRPDQLFDEINLTIKNFLAEDEPGDDISLIEVKLEEMATFNTDWSDSADGQQLGPTNWTLRYQLRPETLKDYNPLPMLLQILMDIPHLRPYSGVIYTILAELYNNALEHGVLGLNSSSKRSSLDFNDYYRQRDQRLEQLNSGFIDLQLHYQGTGSGGRLSIVVEDSGDGFDFQQCFDGSTASDGYQGRGIKLLKSLCHSIEYLGRGNCAKIVFLWGDKHQAKRH